MLKRLILISSILLGLFSGASSQVAPGITRATAEALFSKKNIYAPRPLVGPIVTTTAVTVGSTTSTAIASNSKSYGVVSSILDSHIRVTGGETTNSSTLLGSKHLGDSAGVYFTYTITFKTNAPIVEFFQNEGYCRYWVTGDPSINLGRRTLISDGTNTVFNSGNLYRQLTFSSRVMRTIERESSVGASFGRINVTNADTVVKPTFSRYRRIGFITDSYGYGVGATLADGTTAATTSLLSFAQEVGRQLDGESIIDAISGTGYLTDGGTGKTAYLFRQRLDFDIATLSVPLDLFYVAGGYNDSGVNQVSLRTEIDLTLAKAKKIMGSKPVIVVGPWIASTTSPGKGANDSGIIATDATEKAAAKAAGLPYISLLEGKGYNAKGVVAYDNGGPIVVGAGYSGAGTANPTTADNLVGPDKIHPTNLGHQSLADFIVQATIAILDLPVTSPNL